MRRILHAIPPVLIFQLTDLRTSLNRQIQLLRDAVALLRSHGDRSIAMFAAFVIVSGLLPVASIYVEADLQVGPLGDLEVGLHQPATVS